jgi:hypothetical protein
MARGVPSFAASWLMAAPAAPGRRANMGEPWGTNKMGRGVGMVMDNSKFWNQSGGKSKAGCHRWIEL